VSDLTDINYLEGLQHGDHTKLVVRVITGYGDMPGHGTYQLVCLGCKSCPPDPLAGKPFDEHHVVVYADEWKSAVPSSCRKAKLLNTVREIMSS